MTQEEKELLLKDLCARLPYGVMVQDELGRINKLVLGNADLVRLYYNDFSIYGENALSLPILRSLSSMTEEERGELDKLWEEEWGKALNAAIVARPEYPLEVKQLEIMASYEVIDWLCVHHFDYRGLIERGLAIEVTEKNNPYK